MTLVFFKGCKKTYNMVVFIKRKIDIENVKREVKHQVCGNSECEQMLAKHKCECRDKQRPSNKKTLKVGPSFSMKICPILKIVKECGTCRDITAITNSAEQHNNAQVTKNSSISEKVRKYFDEEIGNVVFDDMLVVQSFRRTRKFISFFSQ